MLEWDLDTETATGDGEEKRREEKRRKGETKRREEKGRAGETKRRDERIAKINRGTWGEMKII